MKASGDQSLDAADFGRFKFGVEPGELKMGDAAPASTPPTVDPIAAAIQEGDVARAALKRSPAQEAMVAHRHRSGRRAPGKQTKASFVRRRVLADVRRAAFKLDEFRRAIEPLTNADKLGFVDAIRGRSRASPRTARSPISLAGIDQQR